MSNSKRRASLAIIRRPSIPNSAPYEDESNAQRYLSRFQVEKFTYMFDAFFDNANKDGCLQKVR